MNLGDRNARRVDMFPVPGDIFDIGKFLISDNNADISPTADVNGDIGKEWPGKFVVITAWVDWVQAWAESTPGLSIFVSLRKPRILVAWFLSTII